MGKGRPPRELVRLRSTGNGPLAPTIYCPRDRVEACLREPSSIRKPSPHQTLLPT